VANGAAIDTSQVGQFSFTVTGTDNAGNVNSATHRYQVVVTDDGGVGGETPATLNLTLGQPTTFASFIPSMARDYTATLGATVLSTADNAALTVMDPSSTATGHLVNGAFSLPQALRAGGTSANEFATAGASAPVGGASAPTTLVTYAGPVTNDQATITFTQGIGSTDALRTGTYAKTLTFTLSTTNP
jgi:hypothetical protein